MKIGLIRFDLLGFTWIRFDLIWFDLVLPRRRGGKQEWPRKGTK
jgi:hypothetical protein